MAVNTIYATPSRSGGQPYLWVPFRETASGGYFTLNGEISTETFEKISKTLYLSEIFEDFRGTLWVTESKHKRLADEIPDKLSKGYREFGSAIPFLRRLEGVNDEGICAPVSLDSLSESDLRLYKKAQVRRTYRQISELIRPGWPEPVWG